MQVQDLGTMRYREAWAVQEAVHAEVLAGGEQRLLLVEHPPVITLGRRGELEGAKHLLASPTYLEQLGIELVQSDRGGDITYHGPGQLVAYPIVRLNTHGLSVGAYVRRLEETVIATLETLGISARRVDGCVGVWTPLPASINPTQPVAKICAIGVRIRRGVSMHGIALNVDPDASHFQLITPCGLTGKAITSIRQCLGDNSPSMPAVKVALTSHFVSAFANREQRTNMS